MQESEVFPEISGKLPLILRFPETQSHKGIKEPGLLDPDPACFDIGDVIEEGI